MKRTSKGVVRIKMLYTNARLHAKKGVLKDTVKKLPSFQRWEGRGGYTACTPPPKVCDRGNVSLG